MAKKDFAGNELQLRDTVMFVAFPKRTFVLGTIIEENNKTLKVAYSSNGRSFVVYRKPKSLIKFIHEGRFERAAVMNDGDGHGFLIPHSEIEEFNESLEHAERNDDYGSFESKYDKYMIDDVNQKKIYCDFLGGFENVD